VRLMITHPTPSGSCSSARTPTPCVNAGGHFLIVVQHQQRKAGQTREEDAKEAPGEARKIGQVLGRERRRVFPARAPPIWTAASRR
jgi:hypothetical protein